MPQLSLSLLCLMVVPALVRSFPSFGLRVPNGRRVPCPEGMTGCVEGLEEGMAGMFCKGIGHYTCAGADFPLNPFGMDFHYHNFTWTKALCEKDSDNDGLTNGEELGDPCCYWSAFSIESDFSKDFTPSHPGLASDKVSNYERPSCESTVLVETAPPLGQFNPGEEKRMVELSITDYAIPEDKTTYVDFAWNFDDDEYDEYHVVFADAVVRTPAHLHHYVVRGCTSKWPESAVGHPVTRSSQNQPECNRLFGGWAPGNLILSSPSFAGRAIGKAAGIVAFKVNVHYDNRGNVKGAVSNDGMIIHYTPTLRNMSFSQIATMQVSENPTMVIPPQASRWFMTRRCELTVLERGTWNHVVANIFSLGYHAHLLGSEMYAKLHKKDGTVVDLGSDRIWHFDDQYNRNVMTRHFTIQTGDVIQSTCVFDSSARSQGTVIGERTTDEMCWSSFNIWPGNAISWCKGEIWMGELGPHDFGIEVETLHPLKDAAMTWDGSNPKTGGNLINPSSTDSKCVDGHVLCDTMGSMLSCDMKLIDVPLLSRFKGMFKPEDTLVSVCCKTACESSCPDNKACAGKAKTPMGPTIVTFAATSIATTTQLNPDVSGTQKISDASFIWQVVVIASIALQYVLN